MSLLGCSYEVWRQMETVGPVRRFSLQEGVKPSQAFGAYELSQLQLACVVAAWFDEEVLFFVQFEGLEGGRCTQAAAGTDKLLWQGLCAWDFPQRESCNSRSSSKSAFVLGIAISPSMRAWQAKEHFECFDEVVRQRHWCKSAHATWLQDEQATLEARTCEAIMMRMGFAYVFCWMEGDGRWQSP